MLVKVSGTNNIFMTILQLLFKGLHKMCFFLATVSLRILFEVTSLLLVLDFSWTKALAQFCKVRLTYMDNENVTLLPSACIKTN